MNIKHRTSKKVNFFKDVGASWGEYYFRFWPHCLLAIEVDNCCKEVSMQRLLGSNEL